MTKFNELSTEIQQRALEEYRYINVEDTGWDEPTIEYWVETLENIGFTDVIINYTGFYS